MNTRIRTSMRIPGLIILVSITLNQACTLGTNKKQATVTGDTVVTDTVQIDTAFTQMFMGDCGGFTGSDGTYSIVLPDGRILWLFGDTFIEGVNPDGTRIHEDQLFIRNSAIIQDGDDLETLYEEGDGLRYSFAVPPLKDKNGNRFSEEEIWFWPGDGYVVDDRLMIYYSEMIQADTGMWGFQWRGLWIGSYSLPDLTEIEIVKLRDISETDVHYGHAVLEEEPYIYTYGAGNGKPHVARYKFGAVKGPWEYFDGTDWTDEISKATPMADINVSQQFSVFRLNDLFVLLTQGGGLSGPIYSYTSKTPAGPWSNQTKLYTTPLPDSTDHLFTYNALAHPQFTENGRLLVSYNMNSFVLEDHFRNAMIYRPRFIRVPVEMIEN